MTRGGGGFKERAVFVEDGAHPRFYFTAFVSRADISRVVTGYRGQVLMSIHRTIDAMPAGRILIGCRWRRRGAFGAAKRRGRRQWGLALSLPITR